MSSAKACDYQPVSIGSGELVPLEGPIIVTTACTQDDFCDTETPVLEVAGGDVPISELDPQWEIGRRSVGLAFDQEQSEFCGRLDELDLRTGEMSSISTCLPADSDVDYATAYRWSIPTRGSGPATAAGHRPGFHGTAIHS